MRLLAFDTAAAACSVAVMEDGALRAHRLVEMARGHAEALLPMIAETLAEAGLGYRDLDRLAVTVGPGAFTGLRIGLAAARGLALATGLPVVGVTTFEAIAHGAAADLPGLIVAETKRADVYAQPFTAPGEPAARRQPSKPATCRRWPRPIPAPSSATPPNARRPCSPASVLRAGPSRRGSTRGRSPPSPPPAASSIRRRRVRSTCARPASR